MYIKYVPNTHFRHPPSAVGVPPENDYLDNEPNLEAITAHFEEFLDFELTTHGMLPPLACSVGVVLNCVYVVEVSGVYLCICLCEQCVTPCQCHAVSVDIKVQDAATVSNRSPSTHSQQ